MNKTEIIPFGKYKGQPIEILAQDKEYLDWLTAQGWFRTRYQNIYAIVINNFQAPSETPEHNLMQVKFQNEGYCFKVAYLLSTSKGRGTLDTEIDVEFEVDGMDVLMNTSYDMEKLIDVYIEIKPQVGDDYPAILRQIRGSSAFKKWEKGDLGEGDDKIDGMKFCLIIDEYSGSISKEQLIEFFKKSGIKVLFSENIDSIRLEFSETEGKWIATSNQPSLPSATDTEEPKNNDSDPTNSSQLSLF